MLALSDAGAHMDTLCDQGFTTYLLGHWVRERGRAVARGGRAPGDQQPRRRATGSPAAAGWRRAYAADLVLFDPARVGTRPTEMVHDLPQGQRRLLQGRDGVD